jgi:hypothetical protein
VRVTGALDFTRPALLYCLYSPVILGHRKRPIPSSTRSVSICEEFDVSPLKPAKKLPKSIAPRRGKDNKKPSLALNSRRKNPVKALNYVFDLPQNQLRQGLQDQPTIGAQMIMDSEGCHSEKNSLTLKKGNPRKPVPLV